MKTNRSVRWLIFGILLMSLSAASFAEIAIGFSVRIGPPAIPVYAQPVCPGPGYLWTPGYWAWNDDGGYYWVPGTWVVAPVGLLWTPGYWGWEGGFYRWHAGYWGPHVGFYGGINYGFGYTGVGFFGGEWRGGAFFYNRAVLNVSGSRVTNVYERTVIVNNNHVSFNGPGGINARPTPEEERYAREPHREALAAQVQHERVASQNRQLFASENHGRPAIAATGRAGEFSGRNVVAAREAGEPYRAPKMSPQEARGSSSQNREPEARSYQNNRDTTGSNSRSEQNRNVSRSDSHPSKAEQKQQQKAEKAERKQAQQAQKRQQQEDKRAGREERGPGR